MVSPLKEKEEKMADRFSQSMLEFLGEVEEPEYGYDQRAYGVKLLSERPSERPSGGVPWWDKHRWFHLWELPVLLCGYDPRESGLEEWIFEFMREMEGSSDFSLTPLVCLRHYPAPWLKDYWRVASCLVKALYGKECAEHEQPPRGYPSGQEIVLRETARACAYVHKLGTPEIRTALFKHGQVRGAKREVDPHTGQLLTEKRWTS